MTFVNPQHIIGILAVAILLLVISVTFEFIRSRRHRNWRIIAVIISVASLVAILLKPARLEPGSEEAGILLTSNYSREALDSLKKEYPGIPSLHWDTLHTDLKGYHPLYVLGDGLPEYEHWRLRTGAVVYIPSSFPQGIVKCHYDKTLQEGQKLIVKGLYHQHNDVTRWIKLMGPAGTIDSCVVRQNGHSPFQLQTVVDQAGKYVYQLQVTDSAGEDTSKDPIPVYVKPNKRLKILILNEFPTFETRAVKEFLSREGHEVVTRYLLTRGKFKYEFYNTRFAIKPRFLSRDLLQGFDVLLVDMSTLITMGSSELGALKKAVTLGALGVFIQPSETLFDQRSPWPLFSFVRTGKENVAMPLGGKLQTLNTFPFRVLPAFNRQAVLSSANETVMFHQAVGRGKVGTSILSRTYPLRLKGDSLAYRDFWNITLESLLAPRKATFLDYEVKAYLDEPFQWTTTLATGSPTYEGLYLSPLKNKDLPGQTQYQLWPRKSGWNHVTYEADTTEWAWFYVHSPEDWQSLREFQRRENNLAIFYRPSLAEPKTQLIWKEINRLWFYLLFLASVGYLWLEAKW